MCSDVLKYLAALCWAAVLPACSVKENRSACPCYLTVDPTGVPEAVEEMPVAMEVSGAKDFRGAMTLAGEDCLEEFTVDVPRPNVFVSVFSGAGECFVPGVGLRIPEGEQCPPVRMFSRRVRTDGETARVRPVPAKRYCTVTIRIVPVNDVFLESFHLELTGSVCGYDLDSAPAEGAFRCPVYPSPEGLCVVRIPCQKDNSLMMNVLDGSESLRFFALGEYIAESGYDWTAENLEDIYLEIDYAATAFTIRVNGWEKTVSLEILI